MIKSKDLDDTDERILDELQEGRATPSLLTKRINTDRADVNQRLARLMEHEHIRQFGSSLYELVNDPRQDSKPDDTTGDRLDQLRERVERLTLERDALADELGDCQQQLDAARDGTHIPDAMVQSLERARTALEGQNTNVDKVRNEIDSVLNALNE